MAVDLVLFGNLLVDDVVYRDGRTMMGSAGGAMLYGSLGAALWGVRVGLVSIAGSDYPAEALDALRARGIDLAGVRPFGRPGLRTWLLYEETCRRVIHQLGRPTHAEVTPGPADIPPAFEDARAYHLAPMPRACARALIGHLQGRDAMITLDPYDDVDPADMSPWDGVLDRIDGLFASEDELRGPVLETRAEQTLSGLCRGRLRFVAHKRAERGGVLFDRERKALIPWRGSGTVTTEPTGAGDAFACGFLAGLITSGRFETALEQGAVSASFAIEGAGVSGLLAATPERARERRQAWFGAEAEAR